MDHGIVLIHLYGPLRYEERRAPPKAILVRSSLATYLNIQSTRAK